MKKGQAQKKVTSDTNKTSEDTDAPKINYQNFKNSPETTSDLNNPEDLEFVNPLFKTKPRLFNSTIDTLQDSTESLPTEENYDRLVHKLNSTTPTPQKKTSDNKSNEIEMGVKNYGYMNEKERPESWDSTLSVFNPYAVDTPIQRPIDNGRPPSVGMEMSESPPRDRLNTTTKSDYSCISDINPHYVQDKDPQYEDLAGIRAGNRRAQSEWRNAPVVGHKKANILYEPAVITQKTSYQKRTSVDTSGSAYKEHSSCCHLIFTILVGVLAIIALVLIFLLVFGVVSAKKCKECDINNVQLPKSSKQTGSDDVNLQLSYIKGNLTLLQSVLHGNTSVAVVTLQKELDQQKALVADLRIQLDAQKKRSEGIENQGKGFAVQLGQTKSKLDKLNSSVNSMTGQLAQEIKHLENSAGQKFSNISKYIAKTKFIMETSLNRSMKTLKDDISEKVNKSNLTNLLIDVEIVKESLTSVNNAITKQMIHIYTNLTKLKSNITILTRQGMNFNAFTGLLRQNMTQLSNKILNMNLIPGPQGPRGYNGSLASCEFKTSRSSGTRSQKAYTPLYSLDHVIGASCSGNGTAQELQTDYKYNRFYCKCTGHSGQKFTCQINYWNCN